MDLFLIIQALQDLKIYAENKHSRLVDCAVYAIEELKLIAKEAKR